MKRKYVDYNDEVCVKEVRKEVAKEIGVSEEESATIINKFYVAIKKDEEFLEKEYIKLLIKYALFDKSQHRDNEIMFNYGILHFHFNTLINFIKYIIDEKKIGNYNHSINKFTEELVKVSKRCKDGTKH